MKIKETMSNLVNSVKGAINKKVEEFDEKIMDDNFYEGVMTGLKLGAGAALAGLTIAATVATAQSKAYSNRIRKNATVEELEMFENLGDFIEESLEEIYNR